LLRSSQSSPAQNSGSIGSQLPRLEAPDVGGPGTEIVEEKAAGDGGPYSTDTPNGNQPGGFQINLDGQQVTTNWSVVGMGSPHFSRDAIAEFQLISSRFDATQGRSTGVQVNAVSKSGTNRYAGSLSGYLRDSSLNAEDPVTHRVVPYSDQQVSGRGVQPRFSAVADNNCDDHLTPEPPTRTVGLKRLDEITSKVTAPQR